MAWRRLARPPGIVVAHPLLTAAAWQAHSPRVSAPEARGAHAEAQRRAAHRAIHARAVVLAVRLEGLAVVVAHPVQDAAHADHLCKHIAARSGRVGTGIPASSARKGWEAPPMGEGHGKAKGRAQPVMGSLVDLSRGRAEVPLQLQLSPSNTLCQGERT